MIKIYIASFNRASDGALSKLRDKMIDENMLTDDYDEADYILAVGDREETYEFILERYKENKRIIHLWAGEKSEFELHDDVYRHSMTLMSCIQLCTNDEAKNRAKALCKSVGKPYCVVTVGNVMLDNLDVDESSVPECKYDLILYNPTTRLTREEVYDEIEQIQNITNMREYIWVEPNGDKYSDVIYPYQTHDNLPRSEFLGLLKNCDRFITNSSCQYYEAPFLMDKDKIISIGKRNVNRESKNANMTIPNASENIMHIFRGLNEYSNYSTPCR